jgi:hypothetical protein
MKLKMKAIPAISKVLDKKKRTTVKTIIKTSNHV